MSRKLQAALFSVVALQVLLLVGMAAYKENILRTGRTLILQTVPVDPRDLFRGDYVVLRYTISTLRSVGNEDSLGPYQVSIDSRVRAGDDVYVFLRKVDGPGSQEEWRAWGVYRRDQGQPTEKEFLSEGQAYLRGKVSNVSGTPPQVVSTTYELESYFVPEGKGRDLERAADMKVKVSVNRRGETVIKEIIVDGKPWEPQ